MLTRRVHQVAAAAMVGAILFQVFLAGSAIPNLGGSGDFATHIEFGYTGIGIVALALVLTALAARRPRRDVLITLGILGLYIVQTLLPAARGSASWVAALHPVNALILFGVAAWYLRHTTRTTGVET